MAPANTVACYYDNFDELIYCVCVCVCVCVRACDVRVCVYLLKLTHILHVLGCILLGAIHFLCCFLYVLLACRTTGIYRVSQDMQIAEKLYVYKFVFTYCDVMVLTDQKMILISGNGSCRGSEN